MIYFRLAEPIRCDTRALLTYFQSFIPESSSTASVTFRDFNITEAKKITANEQQRTDADTSVHQVPAEAFRRGGRGGGGKDGRVGGWQLADQREKPLPGLTDSHGS